MNARDTRPEERFCRQWVPLALRRLAVTAAASATLATLSPIPAIAAEGNTGNTKVTVQADDSNLRFKVPTVIPFVAASDGTLTGPTADATRIENLSAYGLKVTNVKVTSNNGWNHTEDISAADDSINWSLGPTGAPVRAAAAATDGGIEITSPQWNMTYQSDAVETDDIKLETSGTVGRVATDISSPVHIGTVTFTLAPGAHAGEQATS